MRSRDEPSDARSIFFTRFGLARWAVLACTGAGGSSATNRPDARPSGLSSSSTCGAGAICGACGFGEYMPGSPFTSPRLASAIVGPP